MYPKSSQVSNRSLKAAKPNGHTRTDNNHSHGTLIVTEALLSSV